MYGAVPYAHTYLLKQCRKKSGGIYRNSEPKVHPRIHSRRHRVRGRAHSEQRTEPACQVAGGASRLRMSTEEEERLLAGLESEMHKRQWRCPGLDAARGALEGFPEHVSRENRRVAGTVFGQLSGRGQPLFVTEKSDPRHSCPVLSRAFLSTGPELRS